MRKDVKNLKIYLLSNSVDMFCAWKAKFPKSTGVEIVCCPFTEFMQRYKVECVVSPANAYGFMDGGYDQAITDWFGTDLQERVREHIVAEFYGEQPVGTSVIFDTCVDGVKLIHTPTMRYPGLIKDPTVVYHCMRTCLMCALENDIKSIVIPAFGEGVGRVQCDTVADMMYRAYMQIADPPDKLDWAYARNNRILI